MSVSVGVLANRARSRASTIAAGVTTAELIVDWWVGADDRWHIPREEVSTRAQRRGRERRRGRENEGEGARPG